MKSVSVAHALTLYSPAARSATCRYIPLPKPTLAAEGPRISSFRLKSLQIGVSDPGGLQAASVGFGGIPVLQVAERAAGL